HTRFSRDWSSDVCSSDLLDAYVTDFLTRAQEEGYSVPDTAFRQAVDNLQNVLSYSSDLENGGADTAYALYVLARNKRAAIGDLRSEERRVGKERRSRGRP